MGNHLTEADSMESLNVSLEDLGNLKRKLTITVPAAEVKSAYDKVYNDLKGKVKINGFRNGKTPQALIEKRFSKYMKEEAMETLVPKYYQEAVAQEGLKPAVNPKFDNLDVKKGKPFAFTATTEVWPEFEMLGAATLKLEKVEIDVNDEEKASRRAGHLDRAAVLSPKEGVAESGDQVVVDFTGKTEDDQDVNQKDFKVVLGANQLIDIFEKEILGMSAGEKKAFDATLPEDHPEEKFRGKKASFEVTVNEVNARALPEINEEFLAQYGDAVKTEADFDQMIEDELKSIKEHENSAAQREELKKQLSEQLDFELPEELLTQEVEFRLHQLTHAPENKDKPEDELKPLAQTEAEAYLRSNRFIHRFMDEKDIKLDDNDIWQRFSSQASMMGQNPMELVRTDYGRQFYNDVYQMMSEETVLNQLASELLS